MQNLTTFHTSWEGQSSKVLLDEIMFVEIMDDCCVLHLEDSRLMTEDSAEKIMSYLPEDRFLRVRHKYLVNIRFITDSNEDYVYVGSVRLARRSRMQGIH
jgi:DNA-binding LytR/AlgR family response regulator